MTNTALAPKTQLVEEGFYLNNVGVFRVLTSKTTSRRYAKQLVGGAWVYASGAIYRLKPETKLTLEAAKEYGRKTGTCIVCSAELTDPKSVEAGIGPVCAKKF